MRICIDARAAVGILDGIGRYAVELLAAFGRTRDDHEFIVLKHPSLQLSLQFDGRFREITLPFGRFGIKEQLRLPGILNKLRLDLFHSLHFTLPLRYQGVQVVTLHDIMPLVFPDFFGERNFRGMLATQYCRMVVPRSLRKASIVLVDSNHTLDDVVHRFTIDPLRIKTVHLGADHTQIIGSQNFGMSTTSRVPFPYIVTVTNFRPYKNIPRLLAAFILAAKTMGTLHFAIVGYNAKYIRQLLETCPEAKDERVHFLGHVNDDELKSILTRSSAFVFPSLYEGFGLPILEAMACNAPVITSRAASLPEVAGEAAFYVNPKDVNEIAAAIEQVCTNSAISSNLKERGARQIEKFRWDNTARQTLAAYQEAVKKKGEGEP